MFTLLEHQARLIEEVPFKALFKLVWLSMEKTMNVMRYQQVQPLLRCDAGFDYEGDMEIVTRPRGMYLEMFYTGLYEEQAQWMYDKVSSYLSYEWFTNCRTAYIEPVRNYWTETKRRLFI